MILESEFYTPFTFDDNLDDNQSEEEFEENEEGSENEKLGAYDEFSED